MRWFTPPPGRRPFRRDSGRKSTILIEVVVTGPFIGGKIVTRDIPCSGNCNGPIRGSGHRDGLTRVPGDWSSLTQAPEDWRGLTPIDIALEMARQGRFGEFILVLPTSHLVERIEEIILLESPSRAIPRLNIYTFDGFVTSIIRAGVAAGLVPEPDNLDDLARQFIIEHIVKELKGAGDIKYFAGVAETPGFIASLGELIGELKLAAVSPDGLKMAFECSSVSDGDGQRRYEIQRIYHEYEEFLKAHRLLDREGRPLLARDVLRAGAGKNHRGLFNQVRILLADAFFDIVPAQREVFEAARVLIGQCFIGTSETIEPQSLAVKSQSPAIEPQSPTVESYAPRVIVPEAEVIEAGDIRDVGGEGGPEGIKIMVSEARDIESRDIEGAARPEEVRIIEAPGSQAEAQEIAKRIKQLIVRGDFQPDEICVIVRELGPRIDSFYRAFEREGVPLDLTWTEPLSQNPMIGAIILLLECILDEKDKGFNLPRLVACDYLVCNDLLQQLPPDISNHPSVIHDVELLFPQRGYLGTRDEWLARLDDVIGRLEQIAAGDGGRQESSELDLDDEEEKAFKMDPKVRIVRTRALRQYLSGFFSRWDVIPRRSTAPGFADALSQLLSWLGFGKRFRRGGGLRDWAAWAEFLEMLKKMTAGLDLLAREAQIGETRLMGQEASEGGTDPLNEEIPEGEVHPILQGVQAGEMTLSEFISKLGVALRSARYTCKIGKPGGVLVTSPTQSRGLSFPVVFISGLSDGEFPKHISQDWLLGDKARLALRDKGIYLATSSELMLHEKTLFDVSSNLALKILYLTYPYADEKGRPIFPSPFIERFTHGEDLRVKEKCRIPFSRVIPTDYGNITNLGELGARLFYDLWRMPVQQSDIFEPTRLPNENSIQQSQMAIKGAMAAAPSLGAKVLAGEEALRTQQGDLYSALAIYVSAAPEIWLHTLSSLKVEESRWGPDYGPYDGLICSADLKAGLEEKYNPSFIYSAALLGDYGRCPFAYFCRRELRLAPLEEIIDDLSPLDRGKICHEILRRFYSRHAGERLRPEAIEDYLAEAAGDVEKVFEEFSKTAIGIPPHILEVRKKDLLVRIIALIRFEISRDERAKPLPSYFEWAFGMKTRPGLDSRSVSTPLILFPGDPPSSGEQGIRICGKIDRIDVAEDQLSMIIDYKYSGGSALDLIENGKDLQLPLYILAVSEFLKEAEPAAAAYLTVKGAKFSGGLWRKESADRMGAQRRRRLLDEEEWNSFLAAVRGYVFDYVSRIRQGLFPPHPYKSICPLMAGPVGRQSFGPGCDFATLCRFSQERMAQKSPIVGEYSAKVSCPSAGDGS